MPNPPASRIRPNRIPFADMADQMYPDDVQLDDESTRQEENDLTDSNAQEQDAPSTDNPRRTPMSVAADKIYPESNPTNAKQRDTKQDGPPATAQEQDVQPSKEGMTSTDVNSPILQTFLQNPTPPPLPHGGVQSAPTMAEQSEREAQALARFLSNISEKECPQLEKDIGLEKDTIAKLSRMVKEGKNFEDYGIVPHSDDHGYINHEIVDKKSYTYQRLIGLLESDGWKAFTGKVWIGAGAALTGNLNRPRAMKEKERSEWVLQGLNDAYDKLCKK